MTPHDIIAIGASAGGVEVLTHLVRGLPRDLPAAVFVVVHFPSHGTSLLPAILSAQGSLPAAQTYGPRVAAVVLSGTLQDGTAGLSLVKQSGGVAIVQAPKEALFPSMPESARHRVPVDYVLPAPEIIGRPVSLLFTPEDQNHRADAEERETARATRRRFSRLRRGSVL